MRWSCGLSLLVLTALGLPLSAVNVRATSNQGRDQSHQAKANEQEHSTQNQQSASFAFSAEILSELRALVKEEIAKHEQEHTDHEDWNTKPFWIMFGLNAALVAVGTAYTIVAYCQFDTIKRQSKILATAMRAQRLAAVATEESAQAAKESAEAARMALQGNRPYLLIKGTKLSSFPPQKPTSLMDLPKAIPIATLTFKNYGTGPALIEEVLLKMKVDSKRPAPKDYSECREWKPTVDAMTPNEILMVPSNFFDTIFDDNDIQAVINGFRSLMVYGRLKYRDVFDNPYETGFFWTAYPLEPLQTLGYSVPAASFLFRDYRDPDDKERNYHT